MSPQSEASTIGLAHVPHEMSRWDVARRLMQILHKEPFSPKIEEPPPEDEEEFSPPPKRPVNFKVRLDVPEEGGMHHLGTGTLILPSDIAHKFLNWVKGNPIKEYGNKFRFYPKGPARERESKVVLKAPFINPSKEEERQNKLWDLQERLRVNTVQFGILFRRTYPSNDKERLAPRSFSVEWEHDAVQASAAWLEFKYDHKALQITIGEQSSEHDGHMIVVPIGSIERIGIGRDPQPYVCFDTLTPPDFFGVDFFHGEWPDERRHQDEKHRRKVSSVHPGHGVIASYAHHLRITLYESNMKDILAKFERMSQTAEIPKNAIIRCNDPNTIEARKFYLFTPKRIYKLKKEIASFSWDIAFQLEGLLHNGLLHTEDIENLLPSVKKLCTLHPEDNSVVGLLLRRYAEKLRVRPARESPSSCFERVRKGHGRLKSKLQPGFFMCCHVTFTPSRMLLEGPYPMQSNRIIRGYEGNEGHFIRVNFSEEDKLTYRWDRRTDFHTLLKSRVGDILKCGFELGGRTFEFLAYSSSSLRDHSVWFMHPFDHPSKGYARPGKNDRLVNAAFIRETIGNFKGTELLKSPSKYAARLGQAFTATDPSVKITRDEFEEVSDIGEPDYLHTDGVGTISKSLGDAIWEQLKKPGTKAVQPSAYQIRFMGYKGIVSVDLRLDEEGNGIKMRLRKSMKKFDSAEPSPAIEIAQSFQWPHQTHLNRPLVMFLENLHVKREHFERIQDEAIADAKTIHNSVTDFCNVLEVHSFGHKYRLSSTMRRLNEKYHLDLHPKNDIPGLDTPFLKQIRHVAMLSILRDMKYRARIPVPQSYHLVGVADEGPAYEKRGLKDIFKLAEAEIFVCVQESVDKEPVWVEGPCTISRSPIAHPGDIQRVIAIGKPPEGKLCLFSHLKNVVVLPSVGKRSLASMLGGGDLDGDEFDIIAYPPLLPKTWEGPAIYPKEVPYTLERDSQVEDICDFIVEYVHSDVIGLVSVRQLIIADQSEDGVFDPACLKLSRMCSQAVDYPKNGNKVELGNGNLPSTLIRERPDWQQAEIVDPRTTDFYESDRALGFLYRNPNLSVKKQKEEETSDLGTVDSKGMVMDPISLGLAPMVELFLGEDVDDDEEDEPNSEAARLFRKYVNELSYIQSTHTISARPDSQLQEVEIVVGTILDKCTQNRYRKDRMYRMKNHTETLVEDIAREFIDKSDKSATPSPTEWMEGLKRAWKTWNYTQRHHQEVGAGSLGLIALSIVLDCLDDLLE